MFGGRFAAKTDQWALRLDETQRWQAGTESDGLVADCGMEEAFLRRRFPKFRLIE